MGSFPVKGLALLTLAGFALSCAVLTVVSYWVHDGTGDE